MRRVLLVLVSVVAPAIAKPVSAEMMVRMPQAPMQRFCLGPAPWAELAKCFKLRVPDAKVAPPPAAAPHTRIVTAGNQRYLYAQFATNWRMVRLLPPSEWYEVASERELTFGNDKARARRIELRHRLDLPEEGHLDVLFEKIALVCPLQGSGCSQVTYACTVISKGRAVETFRGDVSVGDAGFAIALGDRDQAGDRCRR